LERRRAGGQPLLVPRQRRRRRRVGRGEHHLRAEALVGGQLRQQFGLGPRRQRRQRSRVALALAPPLLQGAYDLLAHQQRRRQVGRQRHQPPAVPLALDDRLGQRRPAHERRAIGLGQRRSEVFQGDEGLLRRRPGGQQLHQQPVAGQQGDPAALRRRQR